MIFKIVLLALVAAEFRWRSSLLRIVLVGVTAFSVYAATGITGTRRAALGESASIPTSPVQASPQQPAAEYRRGVVTMEERARTSLDRVDFPLAVLAWLAIYPAFLTAFSRVRPKLGSVLDSWKDAHSDWGNRPRD